MIDIDLGYGSDIDIKDYSLSRINSEMPALPLLRELPLVECDLRHGESDKCDFGVFLVAGLRVKRTVRCELCGSSLSSMDKYMRHFTAKQVKVRKGGVASHFCRGVSKLVAEDGEYLYADGNEKLRLLGYLLAFVGCSTSPRQHDTRLSLVSTNFSKLFNKSDRNREVKDFTDELNIFLHKKGKKNLAIALI